MSLPEWHHAWGTPPASGHIRLKPDDFQVIEQFDFEPTGSGEFLLLDVIKTGMTTAEVAARLSSHTGLHPSRISYSGLKDKWAVCRQWFSLHLPGQPDPDLEGLASEALQIQSARRHQRKLRRGTHRGNGFRIVVSALDADPEALDQRLERIRRDGVPNYFGEQRFGRQGANIDSARRAFESGRLPRSRHVRGLVLSSARAWLFNQSLSRRVLAGSWNQPLTGECMMLDDSQSWFDSGSSDEDLGQRLAEADIHPSLALWGRGHPASTADALDADLVAREDPVLCDGLEQAGLKQQRRATRLIARDLVWQHDDDSLELKFSLRRGEYATSVLRELVALKPLTVEQV